MVRKCVNQFVMKRPDGQSHAPRAAAPGSAAGKSQSPRHGAVLPEHPRQRLV